MACTVGVAKVTASAITPLFVPRSVPTTQHRAPSPRGPLPIAAMPALRPPDAAVYGMAAMDDRGRITDRSVLRALGWIPGTPIRMEVDGGVAVITAGPDGPSQITPPGHLRLPATVRHRLGLRPGNRMLLAAIPAAPRLLLYPPGTLDAVLASTALSPFGRPA